MIYKYNKTLGGSGMFIGFPSPNTKKKKKTVQLFQWSHWFATKRRASLLGCVHTCSRLPILGFDKLVG